MGGTKWAATVHARPRQATCMRIPSTCPALASRAQAWAIASVATFVHPGNVTARRGCEESKHARRVIAASSNAATAPVTAPAVATAAPVVPHCASAVAAAAAAMKSHASAAIMNVFVCAAITMPTLLGRTPRHYGTLLLASGLGVESAHEEREQEHGQQRRPTARRAVACHQAARACHERPAGLYEEERPRKQSEDRRIVPYLGRRSPASPSSPASSHRRPTSSANPIWIRYGQNEPCSRTPKTPTPWPPPPPPQYIDRGRNHTPPARCQPLAAAGHVWGARARAGRGGRGASCACVRSQLNSRRRRPRTPHAP